MQILQLTNDTFQSMLIPFEDDFINLELKFIEGCWFANITYKGKILNGVRLSSGVQLCKGYNFPFEFVIDDKGIELDPFNEESFTSGIFDLLLIERVEMENIRGYAVE